MENRKEVAVAGARKKLNRAQRELDRLQGLEGDHAEELEKAEAKLRTAQEKLRLLRGAG